MEKNKTTHTVLIRDFTFWPEGLEVNYGDTVEWIVKNNKSEYSRIYNDDEKFFILEIYELGIESDMLKKDQKFSYTFEAKGIFSITCLNYPRLNQVVKVIGIEGEAEEQPTGKEISKVRDSTNDDSSNYSWDLEPEDLDDNYQHNYIDDEDFCEFPSENLIEMLAEKQDFLQITDCLEKLSKGISRTSILQSFPRQFDKKRNSKPVSKVDSHSQNDVPSSPTNTHSISVNYNLTPLNEKFEKINSEDEFEDFQQINNRKLDALVVNQLSQISNEIGNELNRESSLRNSKNLEKTIEISNSCKQQDMIEIQEIDNSFDMIDDEKLSEVNMKFNFSSGKKKDRNSDNIDCISKCLENLQKMMVSTDNQDNKEDVFSSVDDLIKFSKEDEKSFYANYAEYSKDELIKSTIKVGKSLSRVEDIAQSSLKSRYDVAAFLIGECSGKANDDLKIGKFECDQESTSDLLDYSRSFANYDYNDVYIKSSIEQAFFNMQSNDWIPQENFLQNSISEYQCNEVDNANNFYLESNNLHQSEIMSMDDQYRIDSEDHLSVDPLYINLRKNSKLLEDISVNHDSKIAPSLLEDISVNQDSKMAPSLLEDLSVNHDSKIATSLLEEISVNYDSKIAPSLLDDLNVEPANKGNPKLQGDLAIAVHNETKNRYNNNTPRDLLSDLNSPRLNIQDELDVNNTKSTFFQSNLNQKNKQNLNIDACINSHNNKLLGEQESNSIFSNRSNRLSNS